MNILEVDQLYKRFGDHEVLNGLGMVVPEHAVFGFVGQNGAGKTTTMKIALGLLKADSGSVTVCGEQVSYGQTKTNRSIGFLPDVPEFYSYMRPKEYLRLCGEITGLTPAQIKTRSEELLTLVGLKGINKKIGGFSRGMKQRLGIAQALLNEPRLLICDEPTSALDPLGRRDILDILSSIKGRTTVMFSTHILSDVEKICDHVAVLHKGQLALSGTLAEIRAAHRHKGFVIECGDIAQADLLEQCEQLHAPSIHLERTGNLLTVNVSDPQREGALLLGILSAKEIVPLRFEVMEPTLESLFTEVVQ